MEECYEKALFDSDLSNEDKHDLARSYLDYLKETSSSVATIKQTEDKLRDFYDSFSSQ